MRLHRQRGILQAELLYFQPTKFEVSGLQRSGSPIAPVEYRQDCGRCEQV